jgi:uncharacterized membrane protein YgaE (UPF0421/DUF939 family)
MIWLQTAVVFAVVSSNLQWHWTPNGLIQVYSGIILAFLLTLIFARIKYGEWLWPPE